MKHTVFISYSSMDEGMAFQIKDWLEACGLSCWIAPYGISDGESWPEEIVKALRASKILLLLLTDNCVASKQTQREVIIADQIGMGVIPLRIAEATLSDAWNYLLCDRQWRNVEQPPPEESDIKNIAEAINRLMQNRTGGLRRWLPTTCVPDTWVPIRLPLRIQKKSAQLLEKGMLQPSKMIECWNEFIPLRGREKEMKQLKSFCYQPDMFKWAVMKGDGGMGKTRLAIELCQQCANEGWQAGFISKDELETFVINPDSDMWEPVLPTLIVVDYAAAKVDSLSRLLEKLATLAQTGMSDVPDDTPQPRTRLLLLEREADRQSGWLYRLLNASEHERRRAITESFEDDWPLLPPAASSILEKYKITREIVENTMEAWSNLTDKPHPEIHLRDEHWKRIQAATTNRPLYLQLAAIYACEKGDAHALHHVSRTDLLNTAVDSEYKYILHMCPDRQIERAVKYLSGLLCLTGLSVIGRTTNWDSCVRDELMALGIENIDSSLVSDTQEYIFPDTKDSKDSKSKERDRSAIQPDIIAAAFCYRVFQEEKMGFKVCCLRALSIGGILAWPKLIRMVQDLDGLPGYENIAGDVAELLDDRPVEELDQLVEYLPDRSVSLAGIARKLFNMLIEHLREMPSGKIRLAEILVRKTTVTSHSGDTLEIIHDGVKAGREAVDLLTELAEESRDDHAHQLAKAHHLALCLENHRECREDCDSDNLPENDYATNLMSILEHYKTAISIRRELYGKDHAKFALDLSDSLNNKSNLMDDPEQGFAIMKETIDLLEELAEESRDDNASHLAKAHHYLALCLENLRDYRNDCDPDSLPENDYAASLMSILDHYETAISIRRELYGKNKEKFAFDLADSLNNKSSLMDDSKQGLAIIKEAIEIAESTSDNVREHEAARLARYYNVCGQRLLQCGSDDDALKCLRKSYVLRRTLYHMDVDIHGWPYTKTLYNYYAILQRTGEAVQAEQILDSLIQCLTELSSRNPSSMNELLNPCEVKVNYCLSGNKTANATSLIKETCLHVLHLPSAQPDWSVARNATKFCLQLLEVMRNYWPTIDGSEQEATLEVFITLSGEVLAVMHTYRKEADAKELIAQATGFLLGALYASSTNDDDNDQDRASIFLNWYEQNKDKPEKVNFKSIAGVAINLALERLDPKNPDISLELTKKAVEMYITLSEQDSDPDLLLGRVNAYNNLSYIYMLSGNLDDARNWTEKARALLDEHSGFKPHSFAYSQATLLDTHAQILLRIGELENAMEATDLALGICLEQENNPQCSLGTQELMLARLTKAKIDLLKGDREKARNAVRAVADELDQLVEMAEHHRSMINHELSWFDEHLPGWRE